jgi:hypothetical protein
MSNLVSIILIVIFLFEIIYENRFCFQFHTPSIFLSINFSIYFFSKTEKKIKTLRSNFSAYFSLYNQTLESIFQFIFYDTIIHKKNQSTFHENHLKKKLFFKSEIKKKKKHMFEVKIRW